MNPFLARWIFLSAGIVLFFGGTGASCQSRHVGTSALSSPDTPLFDDATPSSGISFVIQKPQQPLNILQTIGHGAGVLDVDNDGRMDLIVVGPDQIRLYRNQGNYHFAEITSRSAWRTSGYWCGVAVGDFDNDGRDDLYLCGYDCSALYHNQGGGVFREVRNSGLETRSANKNDPKDYPEWRSSAGFVDYDRDGRLDLYVCRYAEFNSHSPQLCEDPGLSQKFSCSPDVYAPQRGSLFRNLGNGKFAEVRNGVEKAAGHGLGVAFADYNGDGWTDIAVANDELPGDLFENQQGKRFVNRGVESGTAFNPDGHVHGGMGADWGDADQDGHPDLFVTTYQNEVKSLYQNLGGGLFADRSLETGITEGLNNWVSFGVKFFDYNNDGLRDVVVASGHVINNTATIYPGTQYRQPVQLFENQGGHFLERTEKMSAAAREPMVGRGLAVCDLNNSGRMDVILTQNEGPVRILRNNTENTNHWLGLRLVGARSNRDGFGARVTVQAGDKRQVTDATNAGSYLCASDPRVHFGLGSAARADRVEVRWPSGQTDIFENVSADQYWQLTEGTPTPKPIPARTEAGAAP